MYRANVATPPRRPSAKARYMNAEGVSWKEAEEYLRKNGIKELFEELTTDLIYNRPQNPLQFLLNVVKEKIELQEKQKQTPDLLGNIEISNLKKQRKAPAPLALKSPKTDGTKTPSRPSTPASSTNSTPDNSARRPTSRAASAHGSRLANGTVIRRREDEMEEEKEFEQEWANFEKQIDKKITEKEELAEPIAVSFKRKQPLIVSGQDKGKVEVTLGWRKAVEDSEDEELPSTHKRGMNVDKQSILADADEIRGNETVLPSVHDHFEEEDDDKEIQKDDDLSISGLSVKGQRAAAAREEDDELLSNGRPGTSNGFRPTSATRINSARTKQQAKPQRPASRGGEDLKQFEFSESRKGSRRREDDY